jgi:mannosyltransferase
LRRLEKRHIWLIAVSLGMSVLALVLRLHALGRESLWLDEGFTWERASLPISELIPHAIKGHHNPSYFILLHYWLQLGDDEYMLRFPSAVAGALSAGACVWLGYVLRGSVAGFVAGFLLAIAPVQVRFGQEARMYSLLCLTATTAMVSLVWLIRHAERAAVPILGTARLWRAHEVSAEPCKLAWLVYVLSVIASMYMHNTTVVFAASAALAMLVGCIGRGRTGLRMLINFVVANLIVVLVVGLYLSTALLQVKTFANTAFWAKFPSSYELTNNLRELYLLTAKLYNPLAPLLAVAFLLGIWELRRDLRLALVMVILSFAGTALLLLVSLYKPIFGVRMLLWTTAPVCALIGCGIGGLPRVAAPAAVAFAVAVAVLTWPNLDREYKRLDKEPWRELVKTVEQRARPGAIAVAASGEEAMMISYYRQRKRQPLGTFRYLAAQRKLPKEVRRAPQVFLFDRKRGARSARSQRELEHLGYSTKPKDFPPLKLLELTRSK